MKPSTRALRKLFPEGPDGWGKFIYGYSYLKWVNPSIYNMRKNLQAFFPDPEVTLRYPIETAIPDNSELIEFVAANLSPDDTHGKVVRLGDAKNFFTLNENVSFLNLEKIIPYKTAKDLILTNPDHIAVIDCPCRSTKENPCEPKNVCMGIGEPYVSFMIEHNINNPRKISQDEAVEILKAEDDRGHIHTAYFKDTLGGRMYCMCNCCGCCCQSMRAHFFKVPIIAPSGYVSQITEVCDGCGECIKYCQFKALKMNGDKAESTYNECMGCGVCESKCPQGAISMRRDPAKGEPLDIVALGSC
jgi:ferredoxin